MNDPLRVLETAALQLSRAERARLAVRLIASLDDDEQDDPTTVAQAWEEEIRRRLDDLDSGRVQPIPAEDVFSRLRERRA